MKKKKYAGRDIVAVVPTYRRPYKLEDLLESLAVQTEALSRVIVVDGDDGEKSAQAVVEEFATRLNVDYSLCLPPGQIQQRNFGLARLRENEGLVAFLDDDLVLEPDALEKMIALWNTVEPDTAGIGFNIVNMESPVYRFYYKFFKWLAPRPGSVSFSGVCTPWLNLSSDIRTQWLGGGYTIWRRGVLDEFCHEIVYTRWAVGEDLRFSYPIGKKYPLYACAGARVRHEHIHDQVSPKRVHRYRGKKSVVAHFYFVSSHRELSLCACLARVACSSFFRLVLGLATRQRKARAFALGQIGGLWMGLKYLAGKADLRVELEREE